MAQQKRALVVCVCGPQGVGKKGTRLTLVKEFGLVPLEMGECLKNKGKKDPGFARRFPYQKGVNFPAEAVEEAFLSFVDEYPDGTGFVLDGVPRSNAHQVDMVINRFSPEQYDVLFVHLTCPRHDCEERVRGRREAMENEGLPVREDDTPEILKDRLDGHFREIGGIISCIKKIAPHNLIEVDARPPQNVVLVDLVLAIEKNRTVVSSVPVLTNFSDFLTPSRR